MARIFRIARTLTRNMFKTSRWRIGVIHKPIHEIRSMDLADARWFKASDAAISMADPFGCRIKGRLIVFYEEFRADKGTGRIMSAEYIGNGLGPEKEVTLNDGFHRSYPFVFEDGNSTYMSMEDTSSGDIRLYNLDSEGISAGTSIIRDFRAVDPSIIHYKDRWWMFCTNMDSLECEYLYIFHSENLFGDWTSHVGNPVKRDISSARPGGTPFIHEGVLYRPSQDNSREYGKRIAVNRVSEITPDEFNEETVYWIEASLAEEFRDGTHTISKFGNMTLVDAKWNIPRRKFRLW